MAAAAAAAAAAAPGNPQQGAEVRRKLFEATLEKRSGHVQQNQNKGGVVRRVLDACAFNSIV